MRRNATLTFWVAAPGCGELRCETVHPPRTREASVQAIYDDVSHGTESLVSGGLASAPELLGKFGTGWDGLAASFTGEIGAR